MLIDTNYIILRIASLLKNPNKGGQIKDKSHLYRMKLLFPFWLRKLIFSSFNPIYTFYKKKNQIYTISYPSMHPMAIDFICYSLTKNIHLCEIEQNPYSWIYLPDKAYSAHRIICTGNFSPSNNGNGKMTATIEFTDELLKQDIELQLNKMPFSPKYVTHHYTPYTYPIQNANTRETIDMLKNELGKENFYLLGRFAEWEYYNMDAAIGAAIDLAKQIIQ
jgi:hypothetical protein